MKVTVISLAYSDDRGFAAEPLEEFCANHAVSGWADHFFIHAGRPGLAVVLEYEERGGNRRERLTPRQERESRRELPAAARPAYDCLREWRSLRARQDGVPVYVVFSNRELAAIAAATPATREALRAIEGIGKAKAEKYADEVFAVLAGLTGSARDADGEPGDGA